MGVACQSRHAFVGHPAAHEQTFPGQRWLVRASPYDKDLALGQRLPNDAPQLRQVVRPPQPVDRVHIDEAVRLGKPLSFCPAPLLLLRKASPAIDVDVVGAEHETVAGDSVSDLVVRDNGGRTAHYGVSGPAEHALERPSPGTKT